MYTRINPHQQLDDLLGPKTPPSSGQPKAPGFATPTSATWKDRLANAEELVTSRPGLSLLLAAGLGCAIGWWMKRK